MTSTVSVCTDLGTVRYAYQVDGGPEYAVHVPLASHVVLGNKAGAWGISLAQSQWPRAAVAHFLHDFRQVSALRALG